MPDSTVSSDHMQRHFLTPAGLKLLFVVIYVLSLLAGIYVIFNFSLEYSKGVDNKKYTICQAVQVEAYRLQHLLNQRAFALEQRMYVYPSGSQADAELSKTTLSSLDSLQALVTQWQQPQALQIATALRLSVHHYNKILAEAIVLSNHPAASEAKKGLLNKITLELNPQAEEISSQINDLVSLLQLTLHQQKEITQEKIALVKMLMLALLAVGGVGAYFLIRSSIRQLATQRKVVKEQVQRLQRAQQEMQISQQQLQEKEINLRSVIDHAADGVYAIDRQYRLTVINQVWQAKLAAKGIYLEIGQNCSPMFDGEAGLWKEPFEQAFSGKQIVVTNRHQQGAGEIYTEAHYHPMKGEDGAIQGVAVFVQNVTPRYQNEAQLEQLLGEARLKAEEVKAQESVLLDTLAQMQQSQEALQQKEAHLHAVINNTDDKIIAIDTNYTITFINSALKEQCARKGIFLSEGCDYRRIFEGVDEEEWKPNYERAFAGEKFVLSQVKNVLEEGVLEIAFHPVIDKKGAVSSVCIFVHDITQLVKHEQHIKQLYATEQETNEELQAQQEELRQNLEELMSTQEELEKTQHILRLKEARLRALINNTRDAIFSVDAHYQLTVINQVMAEDYKLRYGHIGEGANFLDLLPAEKKQTWKQYFDRALSGEQFVLIWEDIPFIQDVYHELSFNPVKTDTNDVIGVTVFIKDITERKKQELEKAGLLKEAEEREEELMSQGEMMRDNLYELMITRDELEKKEAQLSSQINAINQSNNLIEVDLQGTILDVNDSFLQLMHYTREELIGKNYHVLIPEEDQDTESTMLLWSKLKTGEFHSGEFRSVTKTGETVWIKATFNPVLDSQGKPYKIIKFAFDITDRVQDAIEKRHLYEKISIDAEELRMQEEELRQNLEELKVIQETLVQQKEHIQEKEARLRALIDNTEDDIYAIDTNYSLTTLNKALRTRYEKQGLTLQPGYNIFSIVPAANTAYWKVNFDKALAGEKFSIVDQVVTKEGEVFYDVSLNPIRNDKNQVTGVSVLSRNINQYKMAEKENLQTIDVLRKIQERVASMNSDKENEIEEYKKKVEKLKAEMNKKIKV